MSTHHHHQTHQQPQEPTGSGFGFSLTRVMLAVGFTAFWFITDLVVLFFIKDVEWWIHYHVFIYGTLINTTYLATTYLPAGLIGTQKPLQPAPLVMLNAGAALVLVGSIGSEFIASTANITQGNVAFWQLTVTGKLHHVDVVANGTLQLFITSMAGLLLMLVGGIWVLRLLTQARRSATHALHYISVIKALEVAVQFLIISLALDLISGVAFWVGLPVDFSSATVIATVYGWTSIPFLASVVAYIPAMLQRKPLFFVERIANKWMPLITFSVALLAIAVLVVDNLQDFAATNTASMLIIGIPAFVLLVATVMVFTPLYVSLSWDKPSLSGWLTFCGVVSLVLGVATMFGSTLYLTQSSTNLHISFTMYGLRFFSVGALVYVFESARRCGLHRNPWIPLLQIILFTVLTVAYFLAIQDVLVIPPIIKSVFTFIVVASLTLPLALGYPKRLPGEPTSREVLVQVLQTIVDGPAEKERIYTIGPVQGMPIPQERSSEPTIDVPRDSKTLPLDDSITVDTDQWFTPDS